MNKSLQVSVKVLLDLKEPYRSVPQKARQIYAADWDIQSASASFGVL